ncbi:hypothetical protein COU17_02155 [Candidatus Kaiserbacteria bacterium CG10_big_fil_rev_8_21_14_0_10_49_17]|uniref:Uncharacterized protein n=1 Tax=Candidatus Kaiserbacteria bacterium CG10_big_fil_rev_8_21_14_0_10_49_17 TaxID=1974609 RepID=A0A2M6WE57_9BACT|nr:MAG: hypothetical protein COU17_02155 [Candidatus Kaiserbacteria bacterium CG10_big_fil_rev_8_21_14_0_10_49_17]
MNHQTSTITLMNTTEKESKLVRVHITAGAKKENLTEDDGVLKVSVKERAEKNMANRRMCELVAEHFHVSAGAVRIIAGHHHPRKIVSIIT